jgi:hypothetical protein
LLQIDIDLRNEIVQAVAYRRHQSFKEPDRMRDNVDDDGDCAPKDVQQHIFERYDFLDEPDRRIVYAVPERLVFLAKLFLHLRHTLVRCFVLL